MEKNDIKLCIENCLNCYSVCTQTLSYISHNKNENNNLDLKNTLTDCLTICKVSADFLLRDSKNYPLVCSVCADICRLCALQCEAVSPDSVIVGNCAAVCNKCAVSCSNMK